MSVTEGTNRLGKEKSPYLLQHQHNPVDWFPWSEEAFAKAREDQRPIFLSIGYSTCHWCHVMERESFENTRVAEALNRDFVPIKVDREERPDVDRIYMNFVQATSGQGGWPLNVFLTPDLKPFFGGTYWPPENRHGRASFLDVLAQVSEVWRTRREDVTHSAQSMHAQIVKATGKAEAGTGGGLDATALEKAARLLKSAYDPQHGGFGSAPKFPQPGMPQFLLRHAARTGDTEAAQMVLHTCDRMAAGGIYDHLGGGFSRYSVDEKWLVPHFEKMLYDNAQLVHLYLDAWTYSGEQRHAKVVRGILEYILRDMTHPEGGFYSAEDADSEGHEGKFYCWTLDEVRSLLTPEEAAVVIEYYGLTSEGNFADHSHPAPLQNQNVLSIVNTCAGEERKELLRSACARLFDARSRRVRPGLDDKVLASWNGLMLGAMARAGASLGESRYIQAAEKNASFIKAKLWTGDRLFHRWRAGERDNVELLEGCACLLDGLLHLYEATLDPAHLEFAMALAESMISRFMDHENGGFWQSPGDKHLIMRLKPDYDGAEPSGNSVAALALLRLAKITDRADFLKAAEETLRFFGERLRQAPQAMPSMLQALDFHLHEPTRIVISGERMSPQASALKHAVHSVYLPNKVVLGTTGPVDKFTRGLGQTAEARLFLCSGTECKEPVRDPKQAIELLRATAESGPRSG